ncbi:putative F-box domain-containing protein [Septoria linicola]|nr:putative F-box domain-containing protein [Septoria linicola]
MESSPDLLGLPEETRLNVISFVNTTDLISLRLTCHVLNNSAMDEFADEYLNSIGCLLLEPPRLKRLANILSLDHFAARIRWIDLTLDPLEHRHRSVGPLLAAEKGDSHDDARYKATSSLCADLYLTATEDTVD